MQAHMRYLFLVGVLPAVDDCQLSPCVEKQRIDHLYIQHTFITTLNLTIMYLDSVFTFDVDETDIYKMCPQVTTQSRLNELHLNLIFSSYFNRNSCVLVLL